MTLDKAACQSCIIECVSTLSNDGPSAVECEPLADDFRLFYWLPEQNCNSLTCRASDCCSYCRYPVKSSFIIWNDCLFIDTHRLKNQEESDETMRTEDMQIENECNEVLDFFISNINDRVAIHNYLPKLKEPDFIHHAYRYLIYSADANFFIFGKDEYGCRSLLRKESVTNGALSIFLSFIPVKSDYIQPCKNLEWKQLHCFSVNSWLLFLSSNGIEIENVLSVIKLIDESVDYEELAHGIRKQSSPLLKHNNHNIVRSSTDESCAVKWSEIEPNCIFSLTKRSKTKHFQLDSILMPDSAMLEKHETLEKTSSVLCTMENHFTDIEDVDAVKQISENSEFLQVDSGPKCILSMDTKVSMLLNILHNSIRRCVASVLERKSQSIGVCFSGGLDSTIVACLLLKELHTYTGNAVTVELVNVTFEESSPDRQTGIMSFQELLKHDKDGILKFILVDVTTDEILEHEHEIARLSHPCSTEMDFNISCGYYFLGKGSGVQFTDPLDFTKSTSCGRFYNTSSNVFFTGHGADELLGGYRKYAFVYRDVGTDTARKAMDSDFRKLWKQLGRDDRVLSYHNRIMICPFLETNMVDFVYNQLSIDDLLHIPSSKGSVKKVTVDKVVTKMLLRKAAEKLELTCSEFPKRAFQFGSRAAHAVNRLHNRSNRQTFGGADYVCLSNEKR